MQRENTVPLIGNLIRWLVPIALIFVLAGFLYITPPGFLGKADGIGYAVCHRIDGRSFHILGRQLPLCARCTGEFNAAAITLIFLGFVSHKRSSLPLKSILVVLALFLFIALYWLSVPLRFQYPPDGLIDFAAYWQYPYRRR